MSWYQRSYRRNLVDMHIEEWDKEFLSRFDPEDYFRNLKKGHVESPMIYIQSHVGYCYWPTESGHMHDALRGRETMIRDLFDLCHKDGMNVIAYYSLNYNNWAYEAHPEWRMRTLAGYGTRDNMDTWEGELPFWMIRNRNGRMDRGSRFGMCCPNSAGYREFVFEQIKEFTAYFEFEGIFFDMMWWPMVCYCDSCRDRWNREVGGPMPTVVDWSDERWNLFQAKRTEWLTEYARTMTDELKKHKPDCSVTHNYQALNPWFYGVTENVTLASDYAAGDLYGGTADHSFACKLYYSLTQNQPFEFMTSRCYPGLEEHTTMRSKDQLRLSVMTALMHHGACVMIDAIDPRGTLDTRVYDRIGEVFREVERLEPYLEGRLVTDVGVLWNMNGKLDPDQSGLPVGSTKLDFFKMPQFDAALNASNALRAHHVPFGVLHNVKLLETELEQIKVLVLPDVHMLGAAEVSAVKAFVERGGSLYFSGHSAPELAEELFGLRFDGFTEESVTYMAPTHAGCALMPDYNPDYPLALFMKQARLTGTPKPGVEVLATMTLPYTGRFVSIHSNPPGKATELPSMLRTAYGKGMVVWAAAPIEAAVREQHSTIFAGIVRSLGGELSFSAEAPEQVELVLFDVPEKGRKYVNLLNIQDSFRVIPLHDFIVSVLSPEKPKRVVSLPEGRELPYFHEEGRVRIPVSKLELYAKWAIEY
ncbi:alpha-L-fucosidase [Gorillibacterium sp. sgz5001074]|uniref:alpha-L-fucosidase n=1 Tax=Gorillibacterium sp. sgz5001074 TaxID=3446695 RepID=UPI003F67B4A4